jgi:hypothetical protein
MRCAGTVITALERVSRIRGENRVRVRSCGLLLGCVAVAFIPVACGAREGRGPVYPVEGKVTIAGEVPEGALVVLYPVSAADGDVVRPSGKVRKDGSFRLTTFEADDGAPKGNYTATIQWNKLINRGADFVAGPNIAPAEYARQESSPWKVTVEGRANTLPPREISSK